MNKTRRAKVALHDVEDVEHFCGAALAERLKEWNSVLSPEDRQDAHSFLVETAVKLADNFNKNGMENPSFSAYAFPLLKLRLVDWFRKRFGDNRYQVGRERQEHQSLEDYDGFLQDTIAETGDFTEEVESRVDLQHSLQNLSVRARWTFLNLGIPTANGKSATHLAQLHGQKREWVKERLEELRSELNGNSL